MKILSLFSGIGAFEKALTNIGEPFEVVNYCEIDKYASKAYSLIHNLDESLNLGDITKINTDRLPSDIDLITYGFPCQDISIAGKGEGFVDADGNLTRSGLFFEALRIIKNVQPKIAIAENVKQLVGKRFTAEFKIVLDSLNDAGYVNYWSVLNSKDYGIPQNRERVFIISIRKDIAHGFEFPKPYELKLRLKDLLEESVDEKYYLSEKMIDYLFSITEKNKARNNGNVYKPSDLDGCAKTITTREETRVKDNFIEETNKVIQIGNCKPTKNRANPNQGRVYDKEGIAPCLNSMNGGNREPMVIDSKRIRKLTPKECFRLMGFDDADIDVLRENKISDTQIYKMAGNSIVVDVLEEIFVELLNQYEDVFPYPNEGVTA